MLEFTDWAKEILQKADEAARRLNPDARVRLSSDGRELRAALTDSPAAGDEVAHIGDGEIYLEDGLEGLVDVEEPHDRLVLRPAGSPPNVRPS